MKETKPFRSLKIQYPTMKKKILYATLILAIIATIKVSNNKIRINNFDIRINLYIGSCNYSFSFELDICCLWLI